MSVIGVGGTKFVIQRLDASGAPVGEPRYVDIDPAKPAVPGRVPPVRPRVGDSDGGAGAWRVSKRNGKGAAYQARGSGVPLDGDGAGMEYRIPYKPLPDERWPYVDFDGHVWRGQPPVEVFQEFKDGYRMPLVDRAGSGIAKNQLDRFVKQAERQLRAIRQNSPDASLEWHFSDADVADAVRDYFQRNGIKVTVLFTP